MKFSVIFWYLKYKNLKRGNFGVKGKFRSYKVDFIHEMVISYVCNIFIFCDTFIITGD